VLTKRIIPCLDIKDGRTVKGVNFVNIRDAGDPVELGTLYAQQGADELVFLDISATNEQRKTFASLVRDIARHINIPFTVGGGISSVADVAPLLEAGADKVSINSAAVRNPNLIDQLSRAFGAQCIVLAIDARKIDNLWTVHTHGGKNPTDKKLFSWAKEAQERGAGEILFTSMDHDGTKSGFANDPLSKLYEMLQIPVIASGGAGTKEHFIDAFVLGKADAALAASIFHFGEVKIPELKSFLKNKEINVRMN
jgi:cyclase